MIIRERALENALAPSPIAGSERADKLHLFVNGNNQTQRAFLSQLARCATFPSFGRVGPDDLTISAIRAASVLDDFLFLKELFDEIVSKLVISPVQPYFFVILADLTLSQLANI